MGFVCFTTQKEKKLIFYDHITNMLWSKWFLLCRSFCFFARFGRMIIISILLVLGKFLPSYKNAPKNILVFLFRVLWKRSFLLFGLVHNIIAYKKCFIFSSVLPPEVVHNNPELCRCSPKDLFQVSGTELPAKTWPRSRTPEGSRRDPIPDSGCRRNR